MHRATEAETPSMKLLFSAGHRSVLSIVDGWSWCPHCGLKRPLDELKPEQSQLDGQGRRWSAITCTRCHARERVILPEPEAASTGAAD